MIRSRRAVVSLAVILLGLSLPTGVLAAPPVAADDAATVVEDSAPTTIDVLANDDDPDVDPLVILAATEPDHGDVAIDDDGLTLTYEPDADFAGSDVFSYTVADGNGETDSATVSVTVTPSNDAPAPGDDEATVAEDAGATPIDVLGNDTDIDGDTVEVQKVSQGQKGTVVRTGGGAGLSYSPGPDETGVDTFTYTVTDGHGGTEVANVTVLITPVNDAPLADDETLTIAEDAEATDVPVLIGDTDIDGDELFLATSPVPDAPKGTVVITGGGTGLTYQPDANANGIDTFMYRVIDGHGGMDVAIVTVTITPTNDDPVADAESLTIAEDAEATAIPVLIGDTDIDGDQLRLAATPVPGASKGTVVIAAGGTGLTYQPHRDANGADTFTYQVIDGAGGIAVGTVSITITPVNDAPVADDEALTIAEGAPATTVQVLTGDTDADGDPLTIAAKTNGTKGAVAIAPDRMSVTYKPYAAFSGPDSFTYTVSDGHGGTDTATVSVTITGTNDAPSAVNDGSMTVPEGAGAVALPVLANDSDRDGDTLRITAVTNGALGVVRITGGGTGLTYDPAPLKKGTDTFTYTVSDGRGGTDSAVVLLTVTPDRTAPVISGLTQTVLTGTLGSQVRIRLGWSASDPGSGIRSFQLQRSLDGKAFKTIGPPSATARSFVWSLTPGRQYRFRIRATDREGNTTTYIAWPSLVPSLHQETSSLAKYTGSWTTSKNAKMSGGGGRYATSSTRRFTFAFTGRDIAWVATRTTSSGRAQVFIDGTYQRTISLDASRTVYRQVVFSRHYATRGSHTLEIRPLGDGRVDVDAIVVQR